MRHHRENLAVASTLASWKGKNQRCSRVTRFVYRRYDFIILEGAGSALATLIVMRS
jgi:hypothetical protein